MSYRNNPAIQARIQQARWKKQREMGVLSLVSWNRGAQAAARAAQALIIEGVVPDEHFAQRIIDRLSRRPLNSRGIKERIQKLISVAEPNRKGGIQMSKKTAYRSAETGEFVKKSYADKHKSTTVKETIKVASPKKRS